MWSLNKSCGNLDVDGTFKGKIKFEKSVGDVIGQVKLEIQVPAPYIHRYAHPHNLLFDVVLFSEESRHPFRIDMGCEWLPSQPRRDLL